MNTNTKTKLYTIAERIAQGQISNSDLLKTEGPNQPNWKQCTISGYFFPPEFLTPYHNGYFTAGKATSLGLDRLVRKYPIEHFLKLPTTDSLCEGLNDKGEKIFFSKRGCQHYLEERKIYSSEVQRKVYVYTTFNPRFSKHTGATVNEAKSYRITDKDVQGLEVEMKFGKMFNKLRYSEWIGENFPDWVCERDGSLEDNFPGDSPDKDKGLELVSPPLTFQKFKEILPPIAEKARELGALGWKAEQFFGTHITTNMYKTSNVALNISQARFVHTVNNPRWRVFWYCLAKRKGDSFNKYSGFKRFSFDSCVEGNSQDHYRATFVRRGGAIETRIFKSNLKHEAMLGCLEVLKILREYSQEPEWTLEGWKDYLLDKISKDGQKFLVRYGALEALDAE